jgi:hypothetical protein
VQAGKGGRGTIFHQDISWMSAMRRDKEPEAQQRREES